MNRLLEGDVGSGKTVVAAIAAYTSFTNHKKSLLMAPTEILANQHFKELKKLFGKTKLKIGLQTGSTKTKGDFDLTIGTHALLHKKPDPKESSKLALVIIDEQHRFGVAQRAKLENLGKNPHRLTMSATPIPRTVALTLYGDLDVSIIDELPHGRLPVKTWIVPHHKREAAYDWIKTQISKLKAQVFVVCPLIDPSESVKLQQVRSAKQEFDHLKKVFPKKKISLLHGKIKAKEKDQVITNFKQAKSDILVATPVIEVGIDIPAATIMLIEGAERFGLAQLHQLRGRVGRGDHQSYCLLFSSIENKTQNQRLKSLTRENSGFKLAKIDLKIRGPGEVFGATQHGFRDLKIARLSDSKLLKNTKLEAQNLIKTDPNFKNHPFLKQKLEENDAVAVAPN